MHYLDYNATTPLSKAAKFAAIEAMEAVFGNPSSDHKRGQHAAKTIQHARNQIAMALNAKSDEVFFTSGGTEASNLAIKGTFYRDPSTISKSHMIISAIEHPATTEPARFLERMGLEISVIGCDKHGVVSPKHLQDAIRPNTKLVSIMHANNEIGSIQPIAEMGAICRESKVLFHTDAAQSIGKIPVDFGTMNVDLLSVAGHKLYGPKGVGCLLIKKNTNIAPVMHGAGHERGMRAGTENTVSIAALGAAMAEISPQQEGPRLAQLRDFCFRELKTAIPNLSWNGQGGPLLPNTLSVNFPNVIGSDILKACPDICASTGSACHSGETRLSATLKAIGLKPNDGIGTIRLSFGRHSTKEDVKKAAALLIAAYRRFGL